jgi:hypothetical protein
MATVSVNFSKTDIDPVTGAGYYSVRAKASSAKDMPKCIFVLQVSSKDTKGNKCATFSHVASPADIAMYPENDPGDRPYYRVSDITLVLTSAQWRDTVEDNLKEDIQHLVTSINSAQRTSEEPSSVTVFS